MDLLLNQSQVLAVDALVDVRALSVESCSLAATLTHFRASVPVAITSNAWSFLREQALCMTPEGKILSPLDFLASRLSLAVEFLHSTQASAVALYMDAADTLQLACDPHEDGSPALTLLLASERSMLAESQCRLSEQLR